MTSHQQQIEFLRSIVVSWPDQEHEGRTATDRAPFSPISFRLNSRARALAALDLAATLEDSSRPTPDGGSSVLSRVAYAYDSALRLGQSEARALWAIQAVAHRHWRGLSWQDESRLVEALNALGYRGEHYDIRAQAR